MLRKPLLLERLRASLKRLRALRALPGSCVGMSVGVFSR